jgi:RHS repeat-associated protein
LGVGRLPTLNLQLPTSAAAEYTTNNLNQYTAVGGTNRSHDSNGNVVNDGVRKFEYNYKNLIVKVRWANDSSLVATYKYDAEGRRVGKAVVSGPFERYLRSRAREAEGSHRKGNNPGKGARYDMSQVVSVYDSGDVWKQSFVWGEEIDQIEVLEQADLLDYDGDQNTTELTRSFYHRNALGSVMEISDANQAIVASYRYNPYGAMTITRGGQTQTSDPLGQHWGYTGRFYDEESELWYYRARYYDPWRGRFVERDPAGYSEGPSLYSYVACKPSNFTDPTGLADPYQEMIDEVNALKQAHDEAMADELKKLEDARANFRETAHDGVITALSTTFLSALFGAARGLAKGGPHGAAVGAGWGALAGAVGGTVAAVAMVEGASEELDEAEDEYDEAFEEETEATLNAMDEVVDEYNEENDAHHTVDVTVDNHATGESEVVAVGHADDLG